MDFAVRDRVFVEHLVSGGRVALEGDELHHLTRVRRHKSGDIVEVFDGQGNAFEAVVVEAGSKRVQLALTSEPLPDRRAAADLILAVAPPKGERLDWLVEKAVELGVAAVVPLRTTRGVVDPRPAKLDRLRRLVIEASKQSGRNVLMRLEEPRDWPEFAASCRVADRRIAHPGGVPAPGLRAGASAVVAIGPEGGWTDEEVAAAERAGWERMGLGQTILRIETAALAAASVLLSGQAVH
jgi:16S rRNA (uracil1498-N3)-methyltransferase